MTGFLLAATLLLALALFIVLTPLLRKRTIGVLPAQRDEVNLAVLRDQLRELDVDLAQGIIDATAYQSARRELEQRVARDVGASAPTAAPTRALRWQAVVLTVAVTSLAAALYAHLGNPAGLDPAQTASAGAGMSPEQVKAMVEQLAQRLKDKPDDAKGWAILARSYATLGRFTEANSAYTHLMAIAPKDAQVFADAADALAMSQDQSLQGEPEELLRHALALDPANVKALILVGSAKYERRDFTGAVASWRKLEALVPADSELARLTANNIKEAQTLATISSGASPVPAAIAAVEAAAAGSSAASAAPAVAAKAPSAAAAAPAGSTASIEGTVDLDPALRAQAAPTDTVFIFARAPEGGPRFPLAVLKKQVKDLPLKFTLDDSMSMMPTAKLSGFAQVVVGARISKSGNAIPAAGDLEAATQQVTPSGKDGKGAKGVKIVINARHS